MDYPPKGAKIFALGYPGISDQALNSEEGFVTSTLTTGVVGKTVRAGGKGDVTQTNLVWEEKRRLFPYVPTPLTVEVPDVVAAIALLGTASARVAIPTPTRSFVLAFISHPSLADRFVLRIHRTALAGSPHSSRGGFTAVIGGEGPNL